MNNSKQLRYPSQSINRPEGRGKLAHRTSTRPFHSTSTIKAMPRVGGFRNPIGRFAPTGRLLFAVFASTSMALWCVGHASAQQSSTDVGQPQPQSGLTQTPQSQAPTSQAPTTQRLGNDALDRQMPNALNDQPAGRANALQGERSPSASAQDRQTREPNRYEQPQILRDRGADDEIGPMAPPLERNGLDAQREADRPAGERVELGVFLSDSEGPGVRIRGIVSGSAAEEAGLQAGDVILAIDGQEVMTPSEVAEQIRGRSAGDEATLHIWRNGEQGRVAATLQGSRSDEYRVGFRGDEVGAEMRGDDRISELEQRLDMVMDQLQQLRVEVRQIQGAGAGAGDIPGASPMVQPTLAPGDAGGPRGQIGGAGPGGPAQQSSPSSAPSSVPTTTPPGSTPGADASGGTGLSTEPASSPSTTTTDSLFE